MLACGLASKSGNSGCPLIIGN